MLKKYFFKKNLDVKKENFLKKIKSKKKTLKILKTCFYEFSK